MLRLPLVTLAVAALAPATASAAPFGEPPSRLVSGAAKCLQATGAPGELVRQTDRSAQLLRVGPGGLVPGAVLAARRADQDCASVAAAPGGAGVIALGGFDANGDAAITAYLREPGQGWGASATIAPQEEFNDVEIDTAVSERGDALVAFGVWSIENPVSVLATRRAPGAGFGAPATVATMPPETPGVPEVRAGMSATGEAFVAWSVSPGDSGDQRALWVAEAAPGAAFGAPRRIGSVHMDKGFDLAVGPDGRALIVFVSGRRLLVAERPPGGTWEVAAPLTDAAGAFRVLPTVALRGDGAAVVVWMDALKRSVHAHLRGGPGPFAAPVELGPGLGRIAPLRPYMRLIGDLFQALGDESGDLGVDPSAGEPQARFAADGRALVTWTGAESRDGVWWSAPHAALVGATTEHVVLGAELRRVGEVVPVLTDGGAPAVAWTDNDNDENQRHGRIHFALEGAPDAADPPAPQVTIGRPRPRVLDDDNDLVLPVRCSAACDVRAQVAGTFEITGELSLPRAGRGQLTIRPDLEPIAPLRAAPIRILVRYGAPGTRHASARTLSPTLRRLPTPPAPRVRGLTARRDGNAVVVRFQTVAPADPDRFIVAGRDGEDGAVRFVDEVEGRRGRTFEIRLPDRARKIVEVTVHTAGEYLSTLRAFTTRVRE